MECGVQPNVWAMTQITIVREGAMRDLKKLMRFDHIPVEPETSFDEE